MIYFTGDQHFGHDNIRGYTNRPFPTVEKMNEALVTEWNKVVKLGDHIYHLGDFTLGDNAQKYMGRLNGYLYILKIPWHHDHRWLRHESSLLTTLSGCIHFLGVEEVLQVTEPLGYIHLSHYPLAVWDRKHYGCAHLHAHSHGKHQGEDRILDVGVDSVNKIWGSYRPVSLEEVVEYIEKR